MFMSMYMIIFTAKYPNVRRGRFVEVEAQEEPFRPFFRFTYFIPLRYSH